MRKLMLILLAVLMCAVVSAHAEERETWEIWGEMMATEPETVDYSFKKTFDPQEFRPTLTPYLMENQELAKGNIIVCSGGSDRSIFS